MTRQCSKCGWVSDESGPCFREDCPSHKTATNAIRRETWAEFYMGMAQYVAGRSRDPSTQVGAVVVRQDKTVASIGFNGFPRGVSDDPERYADRTWKYPAVVHAELNAILNAREPLKGCSIYTTFHPCARCAATIVQAGIECVTIPDDPIPERWREDMEIAAAIFSEAGVTVVKQGEEAIDCSRRL